MSEHDSTLGTLLRNARGRLGQRTGRRVRQADVAEHADITVEWYARIERDAVVPSVEVLSRIAAALYLSSQERVDALHFVLPEPLRRTSVETALEPVERTSRHLRAYRRLHRRADSASSPQELIDMAVTALHDGLPHVAFSSMMSKDTIADRWLHRSVIRPDLAEAINQSPPLDERSIEKAQLDVDGLRFVGSPDYGTASIAHLRERKLSTDLRSGFGVRVPLIDGFLGYCRTEPGAPNTDDILFSAAVGTVVALTIRGSR